MVRTRAGAEDPISALPRPLRIAAVCAIAFALPVLAVTDESEFIYFQF